MLRELVLVMGAMDFIQAQRVDVNISLVWAVNDIITGYYVSQAAAGAMLAVQDANSDEFAPALNHTTFNLHPFTIPSYSPPLNPTLLIKRQFEAMAINPVGIIGPYLALETLRASDAAGHSLIPQVSLSTVEPVKLGSRQHFFSTNYQAEALSRALVDTLLGLGYTSVCHISELSQLGILFKAKFFEEAQARNMSVPFQISYDIQNLDLFKEAVRTARDSNLRVFVVRALVPDLVPVFNVFDQLGMLEDGFVFAMTNVGLAPTSLANVAIAGRALVFGPDKPVIDHTAPQILDLVTRIRSLPYDPNIFPQFVPADLADTQNVNEVAEGYDMAMALLRAVDRVVAAGGDPYNNEAVLDELETIEFQGLKGTVRVKDQGLAIPCNIRQVVPEDCVFPIGTPCGFPYLGTWSEPTGFVPLPNTSFQFLGSPSRPPPNYVYETCGPLQRRVQRGVCQDCPTHMYNPPGDMQEVCVMCNYGTELVANRCQPCVGGDRAVIDEQGVPRCVGDDDGVGLSVVLGIVAGLLALFAGFYAHLKFTTFVRGIRRKEEDAKARVKDEKKFLAFVFHELRNPLNGVCGYLEFASSTILDLLQSSPTLSRSATQPGSSSYDAPVLAVNGSSLAQNRETLVRCMEDLRRCGDCVDQALDVVDTVLEMRDVLGGGRLRELPFDLRALVKSVELTANPPDFDQVPVECSIVNQFEFSPPEDTLWVAGDPTRLRSILNHLAAHSVSLTQKGVVKVQIKLKSHRDVPQDENLEDLKLENVLSSHSRSHLAPLVQTDRSITSSRPSTRNSIPDHLQNLAVRVPYAICQVSVEDTGPTIDPARQQQLFDAYHEGIERDSGGGGLGIVLAQYYARLMGGSIRVQSPCQTLGPHRFGSRYDFEFQTVVYEPPSESWPSREGVMGSFGMSDASTDVQQPSPARVQMEMSPVRKAVNSPQFTSRSKVGHLEISRNSSDSSITQSRGSGTHPSSASQYPHTPFVVGKGGMRDSPEEEKKSALQGMRILIVDDVLLNRKLLSRKLVAPAFSGLDLTVNEAPTGEDCLAVHGEQPYDLIFMDERMGTDKMLGSETAQEIRRLEREAGHEGRACIVACTGNASEEDAGVFEAAGMDGLIAKPVPAPDALRTRVERYIAINRQRWPHH